VPTADLGASSEQVASTAFVAQTIAALRLGEAATMPLADIVEVVRVALRGKEF
jgi:hypothetical protein